ncbi:MAG: hypothetical protein NUV54_01420 [Candidatus Taylorbacteria bacterium]|nr:hypothetical protein [Candidatus Taylorbacteria bacterium]
MKRMHFFGVAVTLLIVGVITVTPFVALGATAGTGLVPCGTVDYNSDGYIKDLPNQQREECGFSDLLTLVSNIADFLIITGASISALSFGYAGFLMMTAHGETGKIEEAKSIFGKVLTGFLIMLSAWLIVHAIESAFLDPTEFTSFLV